jgi:hypothetical protein
MRRISHGWLALAWTGIVAGVIALTATLWLWSRPYRVYEWQAAFEDKVAIATLCCLVVAFGASILSTRNRISNVDELVGATKDSRDFWVRLSPRKLGRVGTFVALVALLAVFLNSRPRSVITNVNLCLSNLRQIETAIQAYAIENDLPSNVVVTVTHIAPYLEHHQLPQCPSRGVYSFSRVGQVPTCSIPDHKLHE